MENIYLTAEELTKAQKLLTQLKDKPYNTNSGDTIFLLNIRRKLVSLIREIIPQELAKPVGLNTQKGKFAHYLGIKFLTTELYSKLETFDYFYFQLEISDWGALNIHLSCSFNNLGIECWDDCESTINKLNISDYTKEELKAIINDFIKKNTDKVIKFSKKWGANI